MHTCELVGHAIDARMTTALTARFSMTLRRAKAIVMTTRRWKVSGALSRMNSFITAVMKHAQAIQEVDEYVTVFYNRQRRHSRLGNLSPAAFVQAFYRRADG